MTRWHYTHQHCWIGTIFIFIVMLGSIPTQLVLSLPYNSSFQDDDVEDDTLSEIASFTEIPRLMGTSKHFSNPHRELPLDSASSTQENQSKMNFAIGNQSGTGGGSVTIRDSFNWTGSESLDTINKYISNKPTNHTVAITITNSTNFDRQKGLFNISSVTAEQDKRSVEDDYALAGNEYRSSLTGGRVFEIAMSFNITEDWANVTKVRTYTSNSIGANGLIYIVNSSSGAPDDASILSSKEALSATGLGWHEYTFSKPALIRGGINYYVVMNETNSDDASYFWRWYYLYDSDDDENEGAVYRKVDTHSSGGWNYDFSEIDLPLQLEVLPVEYNGTQYVNKTYQTPQEVGFCYNTSKDDTELSSFIWFEWNNTDTHKFQTYTSVSFNLKFIANYTYSSNPIGGVTNYLIHNATFSLWNVTFSTIALNTTYSVQNHIITIQGLPNDWNGSAIYHDSALVYNSTPSGGLNGSITYTNESSLMIINASKLSAATNWNISFDAPNYIATFNWLNSISDPVMKANATDTLTPDLTFESGNVGGRNLTVFIESQSGIMIYQNANRSVAAPNLDDWDINKSTYFTLPEANGTYQSTAFWLNTTDNQVGFYTRNINVYIDTNLTVIAPTEVVIDTSLDITVHYNCTHNFTAIDNANVTGVPSWDPGNPVQFTQSISHGSYTFSFSITKPPHNPGDLISVTIYAGMPWFVNRSKTTWDIKVVEDATLTANTTDTLTLEWRENTTLRIEYNASSDGQGISDANVSVDGDWDNVYNISNVYYYKFNSTKYGGSGTYPILNITANHSYYLTKVWYFDLVITLGSTNINGSVGLIPVTNKTPIITQIFADSAADSLILKLQYYYNATGDPLNTDAPYIESLIPVTNTDEDTDDFHWNITLNPDKTGFFLINFTFGLTNYDDCTFIFNLTVKKAGTAIYNNLPDGKEINHSTTYDFFLLYNNTDYNENITGLTEGAGIDINNSYISFVNSIGDHYWFQLNPLSESVGSYRTEIEFSHQYFNMSRVILNFTIIVAPSSIEGTDAITGTSLTNITSTYYRHYSPGSYDNFSIWLRYYSILSSNTINVSDVFVKKNNSIEVSYWKEPSSLNWTFVFNGSILGNFLINITFSHENYSSVTFTIRYIIQPADSTITDFSSNISENPSLGINTSVRSGNSIIFWLVWQSEYGEYLNDTNGVISNNTVLLIFIGSDTTNGTHYFQFTAGSTGIDNVTLTFETSNYTAIEIILRFQVTDRGLIINNDLSTHPDGWTSPVGYLQYGDLYYFHVIINDSETGNPVDISTFTGLPANVTWVNVSSGDHLFCYKAWIIATITPVQFTIQFAKPNFVSNSTTLRFFVKVADSELFSAPSSISTYYTLDKNFSLIWQSVPNAQIPTSSVLRINSSTVYSSHSWVILQDYDNGNYSFLIQGDIVGIFSVNIYFNSTWFNNIIYKLEISVLPIPTLLGLATSPSNFTIIGDSIPYFFFSETYDLRVHWLESINNSGIMDTNVYYTGSGRDYLSPAYQVYTNGTHKFSIHANATGTYQIIIIFETNNFGELRYVISFIVSIMPTNPLKLEDIHYNHTVLVEDTLMISGEGYQTFKGVHVPSIDMITLWMNDSLVPDANLEIVTNQDEFAINFTTEGYHWGPYNLTLQLWTIGYQNQSLNLSINLLGREITITISLPGKTLEQGQSVKITASLNYTEGFGGGMGASVAFAALQNINVTFYIGLQYQNESIKHLEAIKQTNPSGEASFTIDGMYTQFATGFTNITVAVSASQSGLHTIYSMSAAELDEYEIIYIFDPLEIIIPVIIIGVVILLIVGTVAVSGITLNRRRKRRSATIQEKRRKVEQSFEDIKSIRLLIARHESGLQFYSEKTIAELQTDTDALSGMSAALSSFMEEVSDGMRSRSEEQKEKDKIEVMSREGLHMLIWHGKCSSFIIISEVRLPDYFQDRLAKLGREVEARFAPDLQDFYRSDQIPSSQVKKMVRKHIPLHYFSAFILNEGVVTLESIKLSGKEKKMLNLIKEIRFQKEGVQFFFSEQIISHLSKHFNRSEAIKFLDRAIEINLLIEASQEDILSISK